MSFGERDVYHIVLYAGYELRVAKKQLLSHQYTIDHKLITTTQNTYMQSDDVHCKAIKSMMPR